ncbi:MAG: ComEC/Rec2 family competence protein [Christensenellales bacterium]
MKKFLVGFFAFLIGLVGSFSVYSYIKLPNTDKLTVTEELFYSNANGEFQTATADVNLDDAEISVHFLEMGNKYTGDCTYIKAKGVNPDGTKYETDILIDCGSKSDSIATISSYLNNYVTDNKFEYVIVTHAHQDHYAGFATSPKVSSMFDLYSCDNIITFAGTNQSDSSVAYTNFKRELAEAESRNAKVFTAYECVEETKPGAQQVYTIGDDITLKILKNKYYYSENGKASTENDYSVCVLISTKTQNFLFTGDLENTHGAEEYLVNNNELPKVDLYKAGHHGSKTSSSEALMEVVQPKVVCVCCCAGSSEYTTKNENQFPTQIFIDIISNYTDKVYVTTLCLDYKNNEFTSFNGNIVYLAKEDTYNVSCSNNNTLLKDSEWFKANRKIPPQWAS